MATRGTAAFSASALASFFRARHLDKLFVRNVPVLLLQLTTVIKERLLANPPGSCRFILMHCSVAVFKCLRLCIRTELWHETGNLSIATSVSETSLSS